jgi:sulfur carrier protein
MPSQAATPAPLLVNGEPTRSGAVTLAELLDELGYRASEVATALNGAFIPRAARSEARLSPRDRIEIVAARQGG